MTVRFHQIVVNDRVFMANMKIFVSRHAQWRFPTIGAAKRMYGMMLLVLHRVLTSMKCRNVILRLHFSIDRFLDRTPWVRVCS